MTQRAGSQPRRDGIPLRHTLQFLSQHWPALWMIALLACLEATLDGALTLSYKFVIDDAIAPANGMALVVVLGSLVGAVLVASVTAFFRDRFYARQVAGMLAGIRRRFFEHARSLPVGYYAGRSPAEVLSRFSTDIGVIDVWLTGFVNSTLIPALSTALGIGLLFYLLDWRLALLGAAVWPLVLIAPRVIAPRAAQAAYAKKEREEALLANLGEALAAHRVIKAFGLGARVEQRFATLLQPLSLAVTRAAFLGALVERSTVITIYVIQVAVVCGGAWLAYRRDLTVGALMSFLTVFWNLGWCIVVLARSAPTHVSAFSSMRRIDELMSETRDPLEAHGGAQMAPFRDRIALQDIGFAYPGHPPVLASVSMEIRKGEFVAIVGPSGSGKSSVLNVLARLYPPGSGRMLIDGRDAAELDSASIRRQMGFVFQESVLFDDTILENIRLGAPDAGSEDVERAACAAELHDAILGLPEGYATRVGAGGAQLSGGQRQRVAIARALVRNPAILLLDEATSALDPASETAINETLLRARQGRTVIAITHRLACVAGADRIFVVKAGNVCEAGTHVELMAKNGTYAELWFKQTGFNVSGDGSVAEVDSRRLRAIPLLRPLSDAQLEALSQKFVCERASPGQQIIREGERSDLFYLIVRGMVTVARAGPDGKPIEVTRLGEGDEFGEMALLFDSPRNATVTARTDCLLLTLTRRQFLDLVQETSDLRARIEAVAAQRRADPAARQVAL